MGAGVAREVIALAGDGGAEGVDVVRDRVVAAGTQGSRHVRSALAVERFRLGNQRSLIDLKIEKGSQPLSAK